MCGRMTLTTDDYESVARELHAVVSRELREQFRPRFNVAPGDRHWILCAADGERLIRGATWGFLRDDGGLLINARSETAAQRPSFRVPFLRSRCCVVADGFYEWSGPRTDRRPWWFRPSDGGLLLLAGLFVDVVDPATRQPERRFTVLTTEPNREVRDVHDRMPAVLSIGEIDAWLHDQDADALRGLLRPRADGTLAVRPVSKFVNRADHDEPRCIEPVPPPPRQRSLFDDL